MRHFHTDEEVMSILPSTVTQVASRIHADRTTARRRLTQLHEDGKVYIGDWMLCANGTDAPVYFKGNADDVICPSKRANTDDPTKNIPKRPASWLDALFYLNGWPT